MVGGGSHLNQSHQPIFKEEKNDMPRLRLISLVCHTTEDSGDDEAYLRVRGERVWGGEMSNEQEVSLEGVPSINFSRRARIDLYDEDSPDADDHLGTTYARRSHIGQGELEHEFTGDEAHYTLTFRVLADA
jgi:hypothetical protein